MKLQRILILSSVATLAACARVVPEPTPPPKQVVTPAPPPAPALSDDWTGWPIAPGEWVYRQDARGSIALFGPRNGDAVFMIRCDGAGRKIYLSRSGAARTGGQMTLRASSGTQSYAARPTGDAAPYVAAELQPADYMLDRIAFSRGRFAVETTGLPSLAIPAMPEFARVAEDCRQ